MDRLLFATYAQADIAPYRDWAEQLQCGLELHTFADPGALDGDMDGMIAEHRRLLQGFRGPLGFHGAFYDMVSGSLDPEVVSVTRRRYRQNLAIASALNGQYVIFHANYMGAFKLANYRAGWHRRQVKFWRTLVDEAADRQLTVLLENMWADDPTVISDILGEVDNPQFLACLDVSHAVLFSDRPLLNWIELLQPRLHCCHFNNTDGDLDLHWPLEKGIIDPEPIIGRLRRLPLPPYMTLELPDWPTIARSLRYFDLQRYP